MLTQAAQLVRQFGAEAAAAASPLLTAGLEARFTAVGHALAGEQRPDIDAAVEALRAHQLAADHAVRVRRVRMAQRLARWLTTDPDPTVKTVASALERQIGDISWVDRALDYLEAGGDDDPVLRSTYHALGTRVRELRRKFDREFAKSLAVWTAAETGAGAMLTVENFLTRVVQPMAAAHRVLLIVIDGLSAAIGTELAAQLRQSFAEYDPLPDGEARRRAMAAALPSLTAVSRTSLFAGTLMRGDQKDEMRLFRRHRFWGSKKAVVFHKNDLRADPGHMFGEDVEAALADQRRHVAVVLNTVDDRLAKELKLGDPDWQLREIGNLRALLAAAAGQGMAVLITSDHGHVVDRHGVKIDAAGVASARHRIPHSEGEPLGESEILLSGARVVSPNQAGRLSPYGTGIHVTQRKKPATTAAHRLPKSPSPSWLFCRSAPPRRRVGGRSVTRVRTGGPLILTPLFRTDLCDLNPRPGKLARLPRASPSTAYRLENIPSKTQQPAADPRLTLSSRYLQPHFSMLNLSNSRASHLWPTSPRHFAPWKTGPNRSRHLLNA